MLKEKIDDTIAELYFEIEFAIKFNSFVDHGYEKLVLLIQLAHSNAQPLL
jgi:hypothetical protein